MGSTLLMNSTAIRYGAAIHGSGNKSTCLTGDRLPGATIASDKEIPKMAQPPQSMPDSKMAKAAASKVHGGAKATASTAGTKSGTKAIRFEGSKIESVVPSTKK